MDDMGCEQEWVVYGISWWYRIRIHRGFWVLCWHHRCLAVDPMCVARSSFLLGLLVAYILCGECGGWSLFLCLEIYHRL